MHIDLAIFLFVEISSIFIFAATNCFYFLQIKSCILILIQRFTMFCLVSDSRQSAETEVPMQDEMPPGDVSAEEQHSVVVTEILRSTGEIFQLIFD